MPVNVPDGLPAIETLSKENIFLMTEARARTQDIRPLEIAIVNLMPTKVDTETQLIRLLSNSPLQVHLTLVSMSGHISKNTSTAHMEAFYISSDEALGRRFDGLILTGAPVETLPFDKVDYWDKLSDLFEWSRSSVYSSLYICWGVNAALKYYYGVEKRVMPTKLSGVYELSAYDPASHLLRGFDERFYMPQSRYATVLHEDLATTGLHLLAGSDEAGAVVFSHPKHRQVFVTGHLEYDLYTLDREYRRDLEAGLDIAIPCNYYPDDDPSKRPVGRWRTYAHQFFSNWLNHYVYQETPFDLNDISSEMVYN
ncbi:MAG: homoserine O-succinyltransferase [Coriobacteriales bacterium]|jgi:homoserine O-succinyltransferase|nr:homoserine O-succinyltransferase [Coriobacteriales bacterium]